MDLDEARDDIQLPGMRSSGPMGACNVLMELGRVLTLWKDRTEDEVGGRVVLFRAGAVNAVRGRGTPDRG